MKPQAHFRGGFLGWVGVVLFIVSVVALMELNGLSHLGTFLQEHVRR